MNLLLQKQFGPNGKENLRNKTYIEILDVTTTISTGNPVTESIEVIDEEKLTNQFEIIDENDLEEFTEVSKILAANISFLRQRADSITSALNAIKNVSNNDQEGNLIIGTDSGKLAHIVFNTIQGNTASLEDKEVKHIGSVIMETMMSNLEIDLENDQEVENFIGNLELKIIDSLPQTLKAGNITINKNGLLKEMKSCKDEFLNEDDEDEDEEDEI